MKINGIEVDTSKLMSKQELLDYLKENGESDRTLSDIRERNYELFNNELMWLYPISDGKHLGTFIVPVQEGFVSLPYDTVDEENYELLEMDDAAMFDAEAFDYFISDWESFSNDLLGALRDMRSVFGNQNKQEEKF